jgi:hypothetical protein
MIDCTMIHFHLKSYIGFSHIFLLGSDFAHPAGAQPHRAGGIGPSAGVEGLGER